MQGLTHAQLILQDHRQQHERKGISPDHPNQNQLDLQSSIRDPRQHVEDHDQWTHHADDQAQLNHSASAQNEIQARTQVQSQHQGKHLSQFQPDSESAQSPQPLLSVGTTAAPAASHGRDSLAGYAYASPPIAKPSAAWSSASLAGAPSVSQVSNPHALSNSPLLSSSDQKQTVARAGQPPSSPVGPATAPEPQVGSAELCSLSPMLSAQPLSSPGVQEAAEEEEDSLKQLSVRERAMRSLSSKGIQLGRSASGKPSRPGHARLESGSETAGRPVQDSWHHDRDIINGTGSNLDIINGTGSKLDIINGTGSNLDIIDGTGSNLDKTSHGMDGMAEDSQGLSQRAEAVRALSFRLDMGSRV